MPTRLSAELQPVGDISNYWTARITMPGARRPTEVDVYFWGDLWYVAGHRDTPLPGDVVIQGYCWRASVERAASGAASTLVLVG